MRVYRVLIAVAVLLAAATPSYAPAQVESTPVPAPKKPDFTSMSYLIGTWTCRINSARRPTPFTVTSTYSMDPTGYWINETNTVTPTSWIPRRFTTWDKITYDSDAHRWVDVSYGEAGGYDLSFGTLSGNKIVWHSVGFMPGPDVSAQTDITITKVSDTKRTSTSSFTETKTGRHVSVTGTCTKQ
jgi:hypothetical protein